jgi:hypothetical protein
VRNVKFLCIDFWNRPVFKDVDSDRLYGSVERLFDYGTPEEEVLENIKAEDLLYFGRDIDGDPMGDVPNQPLNIVR